jgi:hypothetical protein
MNGPQVGRHATQDSEQMLLQRPRPPSPWVARLSPDVTVPNSGALNDDLTCCNVDVEVNHSGTPHCLNEKSLEHIEVDNDVFIIIPKSCTEKRQSASRDAKSIRLTRLPARHCHEVSKEFPDISSTILCSPPVRLSESPDHADHFLIEECVGMVPSVRPHSNRVFIVPGKLVPFSRSLGTGGKLRSFAAPHPS